MRPTLFRECCILAFSASRHCPFCFRQERLDRACRSPLQVMSNAVSTSTQIQRE